MSTAKVRLPEKLVPIFTGEARYRGAYGGRGSAKTRSFAKMAAIIGYKASAEGRDGIVLCCRQFMNSLDDSSMAEVKAAINDEPWLAAHYEVGEKFIRTASHLPGRVDFKFAGLERNIDSLKSKALILLCWIDEAEAVTETAWLKLIPTVREDNSEIWVTWNPESRRSATHQRFRETPPNNAKIVQMNWRDNPWFPKVLEEARRDDLEKRPDQYDWIWEGDFITEHVGAYFARHLKQAADERRIGNIAADPLLSIRTYHDIGGAGAKADAYAIWVCQFVDREIRVLDYYEAQGQVLASHVNWLRSKGYGEAEVILPHDGVNTNNITGNRYEDHWRDAGFSVQTVPNQGPGAAMMRVRTVQRLFPRMWFNEKTTDAGREALAWYHEKRDDNRDIGLGPSHDWSSHCADAFGLMAVHYEEPQNNDEAESFYGSGGRQKASAGFW